MTYKTLLTAFAVALLAIGTASAEDLRRWALADEGPTRFDGDGFSGEFSYAKRVESRGRPGTLPSNGSYLGCRTDSNGTTLCRGWIAGTLRYCVTKDGRMKDALHRMGEATTLYTDIRDDGTCMSPSVTHHSLALDDQP